MKTDRATASEIGMLVRARIDYLTEDHGALDERDATAIRKQLPGYFAAHLNRDLFCHVIRDGETIVSCAFLLVVEKPMSPSFLNGRTGTVLNVYTQPAYRRRGYARAVMEALLDDARAMGLCVVGLKATDDGYPLYRSVGFEDDVSKYHCLKWKPQ